MNSMSFARVVRQKLTQLAQYARCSRVIRWNHTSARCFLGMISSVTALEYSQNENKFDAEPLTRSVILKNAAVSTINEATSLLTHTTQALIEAHERYVDALERVIQLMELQLQAMGISDREDRVWDTLFKVRSEMAENKRLKEELETMFTMAERTIQAAADAAHFTGAEYVGVAAMERLQSAQSQLYPVRQRGEQLEADLRHAEVHSIEETTKRQAAIKAKSKALPEEIQPPQEIGEQS